MLAVVLKQHMCLLLARYHLLLVQGRTGVMIACYLVHCGMTAVDALKHFADKRTSNGKGVTIPRCVVCVSVFVLCVCPPLPLRRMNVLCHGCNTFSLTLSCGGALVLVLMFCSQMRYVHYYEQIVKRGMPTIKTYQITHIRFITTPNFDVVSPSSFASPSPHTIDCRRGTAGRPLT